MPRGTRCASSADPAARLRQAASSSSTSSTVPGGTSPMGLLTARAWPAPSTPAPTGTTATSVSSV
eukprot:4541138-Lingulodinium_polyedra.AAC.1